MTSVKTIETVLPFTLATIKALRWASGEDTCVVTYLDTERQSQVKTAKVADLDALRPSFKRLLACAAACESGKITADASMITLIRYWDKLLAGRPNEDFLLTPWAVREWAELCRFDLNTMHPTCAKKTTRPICRITFGGIMEDDWVSAGLLEANIPGAGEGCKIMIVEHMVPSMDALNLYVRLSRQLSFTAMAKAAEGFIAILRACLPMGVPPAGLDGVLLESIGPPASIAQLPEIMSTPEAGL